MTIFVVTKTNVMTTIEKTVLKFELVNHIIKVLGEAKKHNKIKEYEENVEVLLMGDIGMSYEVCREYIEYAKTKI